MSKSRIAPIRPSIAKILKRQIGGFINEYDRAVNRPAEPAKPPEAPAKQPETPAKTPEAPTEKPEAPAPPPEMPASAE